MLLNAHPKGTPTTGETWIVEMNYINMHVLDLGDSIHRSLFSPIELILHQKEDLFDYQKPDVERMLNQRHIYNANKMGYGKTIETVAALRELKARNALIFAPKSVLHQWAKEIDKWWPEHPPLIVHPTATQLNVRLLNSHIIITTLESLNASRVQSLRRYTWDVTIIDEVHRIKNRKSKRWKAVNELPSYRKIALSGTPILRRLPDLWAQLYWLDWRFSGTSYYAFCEYFCKEPNAWEPYAQREHLTEDPRKLEMLEWLLSLATIRNPDLQRSPGHRSFIVELEMPKAQRDLYETARKLALEELPEKITITNAMTHLLRLRQITSSCEHLYPGTPNAKLDWLEDVVNDNPDSSMVVLSQFAETAKAIQQRLGSKCALAIGEQSPQTLSAGINSFINHQVQVLAGTIGKLGVGIDGLQQVCNTMVFFDRDWSPEINEQAIARLDRYGQQYTTQVYFLECERTVDQHVCNINLSKAEDIRRALKG